MNTLHNSNVSARTTFWTPGISASVVGAVTMLGLSGLLFYFPHAARGIILANVWQILAASVLIGASIGSIQWLILRPFIPNFHRWLLLTTVSGAMGTALFALTLFPATLLTFFSVYFVDAFVSVIFGPTTGKQVCISVTQPLVLLIAVPLCAIMLAYTQQRALVIAHVKQRDYWVMMNLIVWLSIALVWGLGDLTISLLIGVRVADFACGILD